MATYDNQGFGLAFTDYLSDDNNKLSEDRYEIYVNEDFVGYKTLFNASDTLSDVDDFLKSQGIENFQSKLDGDHYYIQANETKRVKEAINIYCQNR
jgi:hypothetical protein